MFEFDIIDENKNHVKIKGYRLIIRTHPVGTPICFALILDKNTGEFVVAHAGEANFNEFVRQFGIDPLPVQVYKIVDDAKDNILTHLPKIERVESLSYPSLDVSSIKHAKGD